MEKLTTKQNNVLDVIKRFQAQYGYPPTVREIGKTLNLSSPATIHTHLSKLKEKGYISKDKNKNRTIEINVPNEYLKDNDSVVTVPLLGKVTAGNPIEAIEMPDQFMDLPANLIPAKKDIFTLTVNGDSMINVGIYDNDIILVERCNNANNGEIVVAMNDENEVTVKRFFKEKDYVRLQPENDYMAPIILKNATILGKVIGLYRKF
ncbi:MAG TPA: transcriptional repressor LexA [Bacilli bacterium]|nr:transcriptional repressor LexA [Bacilli bacterium]